MSYHVILGANNRSDGLTRRRGTGKREKDCVDIDCEVFGAVSGWQEMALRNSNTSTLEEEENKKNFKGIIHIEAGDEEHAKA